MSDPSPRPHRSPCPTCRRLFDADDPSVRPYRPFCSKRCQLIDLGKWFNEEYGFHTPLTDAEGHPPAPAKASEPD
ncbi:MAG: DNA gyrase inhibitor YacG [Phycisphaerales bacterium]|nr:MAG: DNA gyrase inhibitor YacG [Phycisphaerales bacterium]